MRRAIKVRIYPTPEQKNTLAQVFGCCRFIFNKALTLKKERYEATKENLSWIEISRMLTVWKTEEATVWLATPPSSSLIQSLRHLDVAYQRFFKQGTGYPKFKKKGNVQSFTVADPTKIVGNKIKLPKIEAMVIRGLRKFTGDIKNVTVTKNRANEYFASWSVDDVEPMTRPTTPVPKTVGIDVNLENFCTDSECLRVENPKFKKAKVNKIKHLQRVLSKKVKGSHGKEKARVKLAKVFQGIDNCKKDFLHKLSSYYVKNYDTIAIEDLQIKNMIKNHCLAESISNVAWGEFFRQLEYKAPWYGATVERKNPHNTSRECSDCGLVNKALTLKQRDWTCECGKHHVRDENAAKNINKRQRHCRQSLTEVPVSPGPMMLGDNKASTM